MNKYQEALDNFWETSPNPKEQYNDYQTLQELVDKETPMKVVKWENAKPINRCAKCGAGLERKDSYCWECGQKLDWSDSNAKD